jgi:hypothetical protein
MLQLHVLKLIKSQVPFCGRKWRQCERHLFAGGIYTHLLVANMKVITAIYLNCRPDLRDEWLTGTEVDDVGDAQVRFSPASRGLMLMIFQAQEQALRHLVKFCESWYDLRLVSVS